MLIRDLALLSLFFFIQLHPSVEVNDGVLSACPSLDDADNLTQTQLIQRLTHACRFDHLERPIAYHRDGSRLPVSVYMRAYVYFIQNLEAHDLQFKIHALLQMRFLDSRLMYRDVAPRRQQPIMGEKQLSDIIWVPHIFLANERDSSILGTNEEDVLTSISPDGTVIFSTRIRAILYCWMTLQKFPFDKQDCSVILESWMYNMSELVLHWEHKRPITLDPELHLTEYTIDRFWFNGSVVNADLQDLRHGAFAGNYSSLSFTVHLTRQAGFYLMDYFLPSVLIVVISWVSFWLQADQAPPRIMLGTSTMLTFITLASAQGKTLPKVSYVKVSEIWFVGCTSFIFGSLVEFAFVNSIWRRNRKVDVRKINSRNILRCTLSPSCNRRPTLQRSVSLNLTKRADEHVSAGHIPTNNNHLSVPKKPLNGGRMLPLDGASQYRKQDIGSVESDGQTANNGWTTLTSQEISIWIDCKARIAFPLAFVVFNAIFWTFVYFI